MIHEMTAHNLRTAFGGESMAYMRYFIWGAKAKEEGFPNIARLFHAVSRAEVVHARNHFAEVGEEPGSFSIAPGAPFGLSNTFENLQGAIDGELFEIREMYPAYLNTAQFQQEKGAERSFHYALSAEKIHAALYEKAQQAAGEQKDMELGPVHICAVCGFTVEGVLSDRCPICGATKDKFESF